MEQMNNEQTIYNAALYCRLSKDDEQAGESVSIGTQKIYIISERSCLDDSRISRTVIERSFRGGVGLEFIYNLSLSEMPTYTFQ